MLEDVLKRIKKLDWKKYKDICDGLRYIETKFDSETAIACAKISEKYLSMLGVTTIGNALNNTANATNNKETLFKIMKFYEKYAEAADPVDFSNAQKAIRSIDVNAIILKSDDYILKHLNFYDKHMDNIYIGELADAFNKTLLGIQEKETFDRVLNFFNSNNKNIRCAAYAIEDVAYRLKRKDTVWRVIDFANKYSDRNIEEFLRAIRCTAKNCNNNTTWKVIHYFDRHFYRKESEFVAKTVRAIAVSPNKSDVPNLILVGNRYMDNKLIPICETIINLFNARYNLNIKELIRHEAYDLIKNTENDSVIQQLLTSPYSLCKNEIKDEEVKKHASYQQLNEIISTYMLIRDTHATRSTDDLQIIQEGFFSELNRAIAQGNDLKEKYQQIKQYCTEVSLKIKENASELMVVNNA